jgi:hypothetical protein
MALLRGVVLTPLPFVGHDHRFRRNPIATKLLLDRGTIGRVFAGHVPAGHS